MCHFNFLWCGLRSVDWLVSDSESTHPEADSFKILMKKPRHVASSAKILSVPRSTRSGSFRSTTIVVSPSRPSRSNAPAATPSGLSVSVPTLRLLCLLLIFPLGAHRIGNLYWPMISNIPIYVSLSHVLSISSLPCLRRINGTNIWSLASLLMRKSWLVGLPLPMVLNKCLSLLVCCLRWLMSSHFSRGGLWILLESEGYEASWWWVRLGVCTRKYVWILSSDHQSYVSVGLCHHYLQRSSIVCFSWTVPSPKSRKP